MKSVITLAMCALFAVCASLPALAWDSGNNSQGTGTSSLGNNSLFQNNNRQGMGTGTFNQNNSPYPNNNGQGQGMGTNNKNNSLFGNRGKMKSDTDKTSIGTEKESKNKKHSKNGSRHTRNNKNGSKDKKVRVIKGTKDASTQKNTGGSKDGTK